MFKITDYTHVLVLTGAGLSAEAGIPTFRDSNGLWEGHNVEDVASPEGFEADSDKVWKFYSERRANVAPKDPTAGHQVLVELERRLGDNFLIGTQNVDGLHFRAGSQRVVEMHGNLFRTRCTNGMCKKFESYPEIGIHETTPECPECGCKLRPDIVWFGEALPEGAMKQMYDFMERARASGGKLLLLAVGTSGQVYPAAFLAQDSKLYGGTPVCVNLEPPINEPDFKYIVLGKSGDVLPRLISG